MSTATSTAASQALQGLSSAEPYPTGSLLLVENIPAESSKVHPTSTSITPLQRPAPLVVPKFSGVMPKPALKSPKMDMEALPDRSADLRSTRQSWVQSATVATSPSALRAVKFSSSTKDMSVLRREASCEVDNNSISGSAGVDVLPIEGATLVEEIEEVEEVEGQVGPPHSSTTVAPSPSSSTPDCQHQPLLTIPLAELVQRNATHQYDGLCRQELESHLSDAEFTKVFRMKRESFYQLSPWRQQNQKRSVGLF
jgi:hypothetical protein